MYTFSFIVGNTIPKSVKCIHSATKFLDWELETAAWGAKVGRQECTQAKIRLGISHIDPLIMKPNKVGISLKNSYAYVLFGSLIRASHSRFRLGRVLGFGAFGALCFRRLLWVPESLQD